MRHLRICLAIAAAALTVLWGAAAFAAIANTPHDVSTTLTKSVCEPCHLPHGATGDRLWATTKSAATGGWTSLTISQLCGSCHYGTPAYGGLTGVAHDMTNYAYNASNHGHATTNLAARAKQDNTAMGGSGLPYVGGADIQCSTCHNPHENAVRPFLRLATGTPETLCLMCHARNNGDGAAALSGKLNSVNGFSQHPVNIPYTVSATAYDPSLKALNTALFANSRGAAAKGSISVADALGGKLLDGTTTGNMGCVTCHQVHGDGSSTPPANVNAWLLVTANQISTGTPTSSALCEACHNGGASGGNVLVSGVKDHPMDNIVVTNHFDFTPWASSNAYESQDTLWPKLGTNSLAGCTSCHSAHYGLPLSPMQRSYAQTGGSPYDPTPTADLHNSTQWCESCHTGASKAPYGHHSVKDNYATSLINCGDCHAAVSAPNTTIAAGQMSAHRNWASLDLAATIVNNKRANFCLKCHAGAAFTPIGGSSITKGLETLQLGTYNPTNGLLAVLPAQHGTKRNADGAASSHYLGVTTKLASPDNVTTPRVEVWESGFYSVYADTNGVLKGVATSKNYGTFASTDQVICESCHNVLYNVGSTGNAAGITASSTSGYLNNLLLQRFEDDMPGVAQAGSTIKSVLCVGCHGGGAQTLANLTATGGMNTYKPGGTHPVTGSTVTKASDVGRTPVTLISGTGPVGYANAAGAPGIQSYPAANEMDCDSCHRAHDGAPGSVKAGTLPTGFNYILEQANASSDVQSMCTQCHTY